ncbi:thermonuclease family protein [Campylobacter sp. 46490-21]|uniref:thermonuclease family protein n=1 Tax=Campylobacter magnus TaxID=3026462 RepID=UPI002362EC0B|nr:thermonuclease family protein [Campylobacter magnus]MDD0848760.1 thermonuclease family protein [Campylobacter magnus]
MLKVLLLFFTLFSSLFDLDGKVVRVADGDTITILTDSKEQVKIRLFGIDAPERKQAFGQKSKDFWQSLLLVKE